MVKVIKIEELDCAHCASKMEDAISKLDGVNSVSISFLAQKMTIDADDERFTEIIKEAQKICKRIEPDCELVF